MHRVRCSGPALGWAVIGMLVGAVALPAVASAAPVVRVKARTDVKLLPLTHHEDGVVVRGELIEQVTGRPVPEAWVTLVMNRRTRQARTDENGVFELTFDGLEERYDIAAKFDDTGQYAGSKAELSGVDVEKQNLRIDVRIDSAAPSAETLDLTVEAKTEQGVGVALTADLHVAQDDDELRYLAEVSTDSRGIATLPIERAALGGLGRKRLVVKFLGDRAYNPVQAQADVVLSTATRTSFTLVSNSIAHEEEVEASGRLVDERGKGVARVSVALKAGGRRVASALTDDNGDFDFDVPGADFGAGSFGIQAVFEPTKEWYRESRSAVVQVTVAQPQPVPVSQTLAAFGATAMVMLAFVGLRTRPWQGWLDRLRRRDSEDDREPEEADANAEPPKGGMTESRKGIVSSLRRPHVFEFSGVVRDAVNNRRIKDARVMLVHEQLHEHRQESDARGRFQFEELFAGTWQVEVAASGYVTEKFAITVPHRGEYLGARIDLVSVRERIFTMYREVAEPLLPDRSKWGIWTPRQIVDHVREQKPSPVLAKLTDFVEESYFSQRTPQEAALADAAQRMVQARAEQLDGGAA
jgi:Carboxypeptidase regulatory-like domain